MTIETISWDRTLGNKFIKCPNAQMLSPKGEQTVQKVGIQGGSKFAANHEPVIVHRGRDYVVAWLAKRFFSNFPGVKWNELQPIISEAYKKARKEDR
ncbi:MAG: hypothetical protein AAF959_07645 [Cyanobacteria bacterium P01_D01_bin.56]